MCTGERPFKGNDTISILSALALDTPPSPISLISEVPAELSDLVMHLLAKKPEDRPKSAKVVAETLREIEGQTAETTAVPGSRTKPAEKTAAPGGKTGKVKKGGGTKQTEVARTQVGKSAKRRLPLLWLVGGGVLGLGVVAATIVFFWTTPHGTVRIESAVPPNPFTNSIGMKFVWIPPGNFMMGSPKEEKLRDDNETQHKVTLTKGFYMGVYTVTQEQWQAVIGNNPSNFKGEKNLPVERVSWDDCQEFVKKLREKDGKPYRLPTEGEWEYACRAGTTTPFYFGENISTDQANYNGELYGNEKKGVNRGKTTPVGSFPANSWGLHDMSGNVWQYCQDIYGDYPQKDVIDPQGAEPQGAEKDQYRVLRGGPWVGTPQLCRSAFRHRNLPGISNFDHGLRVCFCLEEDGILAPKKDPPKKEAAAVSANPFVNSLGMKFVWIPPGSFTMGSPKEESRGQSAGFDETQHKVTLTKGFYMGVYTVTQEEWKAVMGNNPSTFKGQKNLPVEGVSWEDCQEYTKKLRGKDKKLYRLPTEAEWEFCCRAGTTTPFHFGETISTDQANYIGNFVYGDGKKGVNREKTTPVGSFPANAWGLHDMHGNVWQWCQDRYGDYPQNDVVDPTGPEKSQFHVLRGGSFTDVPGWCRSAVRVRNEPGIRSGNIGLRACFCLD
jgi:formylglycine-generating enzyme required for sulfatase activity